MNTYKRDTIVTGYFVIIEHLKNSRLGNPRLKCLLIAPSGAKYLCCTKPNSALAYGLHYFDKRQVTVKLGQYRGRTSIFDIQSGEVNL